MVLGSYAVDSVGALHPRVPAQSGVFDAVASNALLWVVAGLLAYWLAVIAIQQRGLLPSYVGTQGPVLTIHTKRGRAFLDWLASPKRFWRAWANLGVGIAVVVMGSMFVFLVTAAFAALQTTQSTAVQEPRNFLVIPGVNDFLPLSATPEIAFGLLVGLVVHEGGHGLLCRVEDIDIDSMGIALLAILPIGAFVEPKEESRAKASRGGQTRMFAAGVTNNFAVTILVFALLFGPVAGAIGVASGAAVGGVAPGSPADDADIDPNDRITAVDGEAVETNEDFQAVLESSDAETVDVELNGDESTTVTRSVLVTAAVEDGITDVRQGDTIVAVDGRSVATERGFLEAVGDSERVTLTVDRDGERLERTFPVGAYTRVAEDGPLADAGVEPGSDFVVTEFDGERVGSYEELDAALSATDAGDEVVVAGYHDAEGGDAASYEVTLGENPRTGSGFLGIVPAAGTTGIDVSDFGIQLYPAGEYLAALGGDAEGSFAAVTDSFLGKIAFSLFLPIGSVVGTLPFNFAGFTGGIQNFYAAQGPLAALGDGGVFLLANALFWTGWINVQLAFFNCIPAFPLDGGHILRTSTEAVVSRLPLEANRGMVRTVTTSVGLAMLLSFVLMLFGPRLVAG